MPDPLQHVNPGDPPPMRAATYNALFDAARAHRDRKQLRAGQGDAPVRHPIPSLDVWVRNDTGSTLPIRSVVALGTPVISAVDYPIQVQRDPVFPGTAPSGSDVVFAITTEPAEDGKLCRAVVMGIAVVDVVVNDAGHEYAEPATGVTATLASSESGPAVIVSRESGSSGTKRAVVLIDRSDDVRPPFVAQITRAYDGTDAGRTGYGWRAVVLKKNGDKEDHANGGSYDPPTASSDPVAIKYLPPPGLFAEEDAEEGDYAFEIGDNQMVPVGTFVVMTPVPTPPSDTEEEEPQKYVFHQPEILIGNIGEYDASLSENYPQQLSPPSRPAINYTWTPGPILSYGATNNATDTSLGGSGTGPDICARHLNPTTTPDLANPATFVPAGTQVVIFRQGWEWVFQYEIPPGPGCGLEYDPDTNLLSVDVAGLAGDGLTVQEGESPSDCDKLKVDLPYIYPVPSDYIGCGLTTAGGKTVVDLVSFSFEGLCADNEACSLAVNIGCGIKYGVANDCGTEPIEFDVETVVGDQCLTSLKKEGECGMAVDLTVDSTTTEEFDKITAFGVAAGGAISITVLRSNCTNYFNCAGMLIDRDCTTSTVVLPGPAVEVLCECCDADPLDAASTYDVNEGEAPLDVEFTGGATGGVSDCEDGYTYAWDFGDGTTSEEQNPSHTFEEEGEYTVVLTVTDCCGVSDTAPDIVVTVGEDCCPGVDPLPDTLCVTFNGGLAELGTLTLTRDTPGGCVWSYTPDPETPFVGCPGEAFYGATITQTTVDDVCTLSITAIVGSPESGSWTEEGFDGTLPLTIAETAVGGGVGYSLLLLAAGACSGGVDCHPTISLCGP